MIDQARIDAFARCTGDHQWIHVDVERARTERPSIGTVAHGYLTLSLLAPTTFEILSARLEVREARAWTKRTCMARSNPRPRTGTARPATAGIAAAAVAPVGSRRKNVEALVVRERPPLAATTQKEAHQILTRRLQHDLTEFYRRRSGAPAPRSV
jgi:hypothetical protein